MNEIFKTILEKRAAGIPVGLYSVCSSNPMVLEATIRRVAITKRPVLIEATANQVNQFGGYTGMTPTDFVKKIETLLKIYGVSKDLIVFGGDHLGPYPWRELPSAIALGNAEILIRQFVAAGAQKVHLDASMPLGDDRKEVLDPEVIARRSALLCLAAEDEFKKLQSNGILTIPPIYIIGTEVPAPGGETVGLEHDSSELAIRPTTRESFELTYEVHKRAFEEQGLTNVWKRVMAVVVQPGVDFDSSKVYQFQPKNIKNLREALVNKSDIFFEAHSTDYQTTDALKNLVKEGFVFLKVGPALTFAYREALFGLSQVSRILGLQKDSSSLEDFMVEIMNINKSHWSSYYQTGDTQTLLFSLSDRIRYYWDIPEVQQRVDQLLEELSGVRFSVGILSQFFPRLGSLEDIVTRLDSYHSKQIVLDLIDAELTRYENACMVSE